MSHYVYFHCHGTITFTKNMFIADYSEVWPSFHETAGDTVLFPTLKKSPNDFVNLLILRGKFEGGVWNDILAVFYEEQLSLDVMSNSPFLWEVRLVEIRNINSMVIAF